MNKSFTVSPLNYIGGKARILDQLLPAFPEHISTFVDMFCGGCNVGINTNADNYIYNDNNRELIGLLKTFLRLNTDTILRRLDEIVDFYGFSKTKEHSFAYYGGNSAIGVSRYNKEPYLRLRHDYNMSARNNQHYIMLYALVVFGFNNQLRFNDRGEFNLPVGKRDFNNVIRHKLEAFVNKLKEQKPLIQSQDFRKFNIDQLDTESLVYLDPPYLISTATYNEGGGWTEKDEHQLFEALTRTPAKFILSTWHHNDYRSNEMVKLYWDRFNVMTKDHFYHNGGSIENRHAVVEALVFNFDIHEKMEIRTAKQLELFAEAV